MGVSKQCLGVVDERTVNKLSTPLWEFQISFAVTLNVFSVHLSTPLWEFQLEEVVPRRVAGGVRLSTPLWEFQGLRHDRRPVEGAMARAFLLPYGSF